MRTFRKATLTLILASLWTPFAWGITASWTDADFNHWTCTATVGSYIALQADSWSEAGMVWKINPDDDYSWQEGANYTTDSTFTLNPSTQGDIVSVGYSGIYGVYGSGANWAFMVRQNGKYFVTSTVFSASGSGTNLTAADFTEVGGTAHPDFSSAGSEIKFGFYHVGWQPNATMYEFSVTVVQNLPPTGIAWFDADFPHWTYTATVGNYIAMQADSWSEPGMVWKVNPNDDYSWREGANYTADSTFTVTPSASGEITGVSYTGSYWVYGTGANWAFMVKQNGKYYVTARAFSTSGSGTNLTAADFTEVGGTAHPDFSLAGSEIKFGFYHVGWQPGGLMVDFSVVANQIPHPRFDIPAGRATVDGNLADWAGSTWIPLDQNYDGGGAPDVTSASYAVRWSENKVYVAVKVQDTAHYFSSDYGIWNGRDAVEIYLHTTGTGAVNYHAGQEAAQQYTVGIKSGTSDQVWVSLTDTNAMPAGAGFVAAGKVDGDWIYYEAEMTPFQYFGGMISQPDILSPLHAGDIIGVDVCVVGSNGGYTGMKAENTLAGKSANWGNFRRHTLVPAVQIAGDANGDGKVDVSDLGILAANYGSTFGATWELGDFNNDGKVDVSDLGILAANYGTGAGSTHDFTAEAKADTPVTSALGCGSAGLTLVVGFMLLGVMFMKDQVLSA